LILTSVLVLQGVPKNLSLFAEDFLLLFAESLLPFLIVTFAKFSGIQGRSQEEKTKGAKTNSEINEIELIQSVTSALLKEMSKAGHRNIFCPLSDLCLLVGHKKSFTHLV
jgi:hypothetical protein